jgi:DNA-binding CsgD family transcriptional regulator/tetratricopeptide (TPR) repeat protein
VCRYFAVGMRGVGFGDWRLVGRAEERDFVSQRLRSPSCAGLVLAGPAGVGKTRLAREVSEVLAGEFEIEWCTATRAEVSIPFGALAQLVNVGGAARGTAETIRAAVDALQSRSVVLVVDDVQLLDEASALLLQACVLGGAARVLLTLRHGEQAPSAVSGLWRDGTCEVVELQPLSRSETSTLLEDALGGPVEPTSADRIYDLTDGNLLFLRELVRAGLDGATLQAASGIWRWRGPIGVGRGLRDLIQDAFRGLDDAEREALLLVALGEPLPSGMLAELVEQSVVVELAARGLLTATGLGEAAEVRLGHPLYGEVLRADCPALVRMDLMRRLVRTSYAADERNGVQLRRMGVWALHAGVELPAVTLAAAAREALGSGDPENALLLAEAAIAREGAFAPELTRALALHDLGRFEAADSALAALTPEAPDDEARAEVAMARIQSLYYALSRAEDAIQVLADAERSIDTPALRDLLAAQRAMALAFENRIEEAGEIAIPLLDSSDERVALRALSPAATLLILHGKSDVVIDRSIPLMEAAWRRRTQLPRAPFWVLSSYGNALVSSGRLHDAADLGAMVEGLLEGADPDSLAHLAILQGQLAMLRGRPRTATRYLREAIGRLDERDLVGRSRWARSLLSEALAHAGEPESSQETADEAARRPSDLSRHVDGDAARARAWATAAARSPTLAQREALAVADTQHDLAPLWEMRALLDVLRLGSDDRAIAERLAAVAATIDGGLAGASVDFATGIAQRDPERLAQANTKYAELGFMLYAAESASAAAAMYEAAGRRFDASRLRARAAEGHAQCEGAWSPRLNSVDSALRLTPRELEVARLAAQNLTSRQIAERLICSNRTVDNHLARVYTKLGVNNRAELRDRLPPV